MQLNAGHTPSATHPSRPSMSVRSDEKVQLEGHQSTRPTASLEGSLAQVISKIGALTTTIVEQNRKIEMLVHDNTDLRDEIRNLSQTLQLSKRDLQRIEHTIPKMIGELKGKFEKMLEKSESRFQGPIDRLLEELGRLHANPSAPVHMPSITTSPSNAPFAPEPAPGDSEWAPRDDFIPADHLNKQHYQENFEQHVGPPVRFAATLIYSESLITRYPRSITSTADPASVPSEGAAADFADTIRGTVPPSTDRISLPSRRATGSYA
jgi:hypothetical protein